MLHAGGLHHGHEILQVACIAIEVLPYAGIICLHGDRDICHSASEVILPTSRRGSRVVKLCTISKTDMHLGHPHSPIECIELIRLHGGASRLGNNAPVQLVIFAYKRLKFSSIVRLHRTHNPLKFGAAEYGLSRTIGCEPDKALAKRHSADTGMHVVDSTGVSSSASAIQTG